jgi:hypothetical protein
VSRFSRDNLKARLAGQGVHVGTRSWKFRPSTLNPLPYKTAVQMEHDLAADLRAQGCTVTGGT